MEETHAAGDDLLQVRPKANLSNTYPRFLPKRTVLEIAGISAATLNRKLRAGTFPPPCAADGNFVRWDSEAVEVWRRERASNPQKWIEDREQERAWRQSRQSAEAA